MSTPSPSPSMALLGCSLTQGDCLTILRDLPDGFVNCCVTSPPYYGLRDYQTVGQIGLETTPQHFIEKLVEVFREVSRVLTDDGTLWVVIGDSYAGSWGNQGRKETRGGQRPVNGPMIQNLDPYPVQQSNTGSIPKGSGLKSKDLIGIPWMLAFALRADGWYLRQDIIWAKPNPMPESVRDRCTKSHEYVFLLSKSPRYYFDSQVISEPCAGLNEHDVTGPGYSAPGQSPHTGTRKSGNKARKSGASRGIPGAPTDGSTNGAVASSIPWEGSRRNKRDVWTIPTQCFKGAHFATFPERLVEPCILAGCPPGGIVADIFMGSGTVGVVALRHGRVFIGIELNPEYCAMAETRILSSIGT